jgi:hypothetical protein
MLREQILDALKELRLGGMKGAYDELMAGAQKRGLSQEKFLWSLLEAEMTERDCRSLRSVWAGPLYGTERTGEL